MNKSQKKTLAVSAGIAALTAAAAGVYILTDKNSRKKIAKWTKDMKSDVVSELNQVSKATKSTYNTVVDEVAKNYKSLKNISAEELAETVSELKGHWTTISKEAMEVKDKVTKALPKSKKTPTKKATKKVSKKTTKKK